MARSRACRIDETSPYSQASPVSEPYSQPDHPWSQTTARLMSDASEAESGAYVFSGFSAHLWGFGRADERTRSADLLITSDGEGCSDLRGFANLPYLSRFPFPGLHAVASYCAPGGVRVVSGDIDFWSLALAVRARCLTPLAHPLWFALRGRSGASPTRSVTGLRGAGRRCRARAQGTPAPL